jgi:hypothetical protein
MATCNSIPAHTADKITKKLNEVAIMLRAMRVIARSTETDEGYEALASTVEGLSERAHLIVDACIQKMGGLGLGNYNDHDWDAEDDPEEGGAA